MKSTPQSNHNALSNLLNWITITVHSCGATSATPDPKWFSHYTLKDVTGKTRDFHGINLNGFGFVFEAKLPSNFEKFCKSVQCSYNLDVPAFQGIPLYLAKKAKRIFKPETEKIRLSVNRFNPQALSQELLKEVVQENKLIPVYVVDMAKILSSSTFSTETCLIVPDNDAYTYIDMDGWSEPTVVSSKVKPSSNTHKALTHWVYDEINPQLDEEMRYISDTALESKDINFISGSAKDLDQQMSALLVLAANAYPTLSAKLGSLTVRAITHSDEDDAPLAQFDYAIEELPKSKRGVLRNIAQIAQLIIEANEFDGSAYEYNDGAYLRMSGYSQVGATIDFEIPKEVSKHSVIAAYQLISNFLIERNQPLTLLPSLDQVPEL